MRRLLVTALASSTALAVAGVAGGTAAAPSIQLQPRVVRPGAVLAIRGAHFRPRLVVALSIRLATGGKRSALGTVRATAAGTFRFSKRISRSTTAGKYVVRACQRSCRIRASASFLVPKVTPT